MKVWLSEMVHYNYEAVGTCGCCDICTRVNIMLSLLSVFKHSDNNIFHTFCILSLKCTHTPISGH